MVLHGITAVRIMLQEQTGTSTKTAIFGVISQECRFIQMAV